MTKGKGSKRPSPKREPSLQVQVRRMFDEILHHGAQMERNAIRDFLRREHRQMEKGISGFKNSKDALTYVLLWIDGRVKRYRSRKDGL